MPRSRPGPAIARPRTATVPSVGCSKPATMRNSVDFPQPDAPIRQTNCPGATARSMRPSASISPSRTLKRLVTPVIASVGAAAASLMVLRAPRQKAVADLDDDAIGHEACHPDDDHAGDHEIGARQRAAIH